MLKRNFKTVSLILRLVFSFFLIFILSSCRGENGNLGPSGSPGEKGDQGPPAQDPIFYEYELVQVSEKQEGDLEEINVIKFSIENTTSSGQALALPVNLEIVNKENLEIQGGTCLNIGFLEKNEFCSFFLKTKGSRPTSIKSFVKTVLNSKEKYKSVSFELLNPVIEDLQGGNEAVCYLSKKKVFCKGNNYYKQVENSSERYVTSFKQIEISNVEKIFYLPNKTFCAVDNLKELYCWGDVFGVSSNNPVKINASDVEEVSGSSSEICILSNGVFSCYSNRTTVVIQPFIGESVKQILVGEDFKCVVSISSSVYCWGNGSKGQLGNGELNDYSTPQRVKMSHGPFLAGVKKIKKGASYICSLSETGFSLYCWGTANPGIFISNGVISASAVSIEFGMYSTGFDFVSDLFMGDSQISILKNGLLYSRGKNDYGQLGFDSVYPEYSSPRFYPVRVLEDQVKTIVFGVYSSCALLKSNEIKCFGLYPW